MKRLSSMMAALAALILACCALGGAGLAETDAPVDPAVFRVGYQTAQELAARYGLESALFITDSLYTPAQPQPLCAYIITHSDCEIGINKDGMYPVSEKGLRAPLTDYLKEWAEEIMEESGGLIRFVNDPDYADILIIARQTYEYYGKYSGAGITATGYSCNIKWWGYHLTRPSDETAYTSKTKKPAQTESLSGGGKFWKKPPEFKGSLELQAFVESILRWYGLANGASDESRHYENVKQVLIARGYLSGEAAGGWDLAYAEALQRFQADNGIHPSGRIGRATLAALYRDADTVAAVLALYPEEAPHEEPAPTDTPTPSPAPTETAKSGPAIGTPDHANDKENSKKKGK